MSSFQNPLLPDCFLTWSEPPDEAGEEVFRIVSWRRSLTLKGHSFREFAHAVLPLLNGRHSFAEIAAECADLFNPEDLEAALATLGAQGVVVEGAAPETDAPPRLAPQLGYLGEIAEEGRAAQRRLTAAKVVIFGMDGAGAALARSLASAGVGRLVCVDPYPVGAIDPYFSSLFAPTDAGRNRAECVAERLGDAAPEVAIEAKVERLDTTEGLAAALEGVDLVVCCLESGDLNWVLKLNRACRNAGVRWLAGALEGAEVVAGPGFPPVGEGPCYMCYRMREVACAANPQARFGLERRLDRMQRSLGARRENLACGADLLAGLLGAEALNCLAGIAEPALDGRILVTDLITLRQEKHVVLRKPGCAVCGAGPTG